MMLHTLLSHPLTRGLKLDAPETTRLRRRIIREKGFLRHIYEEWYDRLAVSLRGSPAGLGPVLEIGSGAGFAADRLPHLIPSDLIATGGAALCCDAVAGLPFRAGCLRGIVMVNTFHHLPDPEAFLQQADRCLASGATLAMIEPWVSRWSAWVYRHLHHEPFVPDAPHWGFVSSGPLTGANEALPWIVFQRDRARFERLFPGLRIISLEPFMPFRYLISGGVSLRTLVPEVSFRLFTAVERWCRPSMNDLAMFAHITIRKA